MDVVVVRILIPSGWRGNHPPQQVGIVLLWPDETDIAITPAEGMISEGDMKADG
jgi:hypothetical protein